MATLQGISPGLAAAFQALVAASPFKLGISSGLRSRAKQQELYNEYLAGQGPLAAPPGSSNHETGNAIDIDFFDNPQAVQWVHQNAARFGLHFPVRGENWHAELSGEGNPAAGLDPDVASFNDAAQNPEDVLTARLDSIVSMLTGGTPSAETPQDVTAPVATDVTVLEPAAPAVAPGGPAGTGDQMSNARIIYQVGRQLGMPDKAIQIALAAALVESNLINVRHGDRDSLGLFQQRPSQGWGSPDQVMDPMYAARKFFEGLSGINWQGMAPGDAAQAVQRSAFPDRYAERWGEAQSIFNQLGVS